MSEAFRQDLDWLKRHQAPNSVANFCERWASVVLSKTDAEVEEVQDFLREHDANPEFPGGAALLATRNILARRLEVVEAAIERLGLYVIEDEAPRWLPRVIDGG
jgi:hypothetical protein